MSGVSALWQRRPVLFALGLATLTVAGLVVMLGDAAAWKAAGFVLAALPPVTAAVAYRRQCRRRGAS
ncbi:hypothetical protein [Methylobacterium radiotolerans]|uniref:hypothetical protein n=1 Tax=Methylobacterium radiotolerans TaxID=31998 RepID=UPI00097873AB|nr:hypothetical protein [Methylobacterium radiotolerans]